MELGRAIRHKNDWASLILLDSRYSSQKVRNKLPAWINEGIVITETFGKAVRTLAQFYNTKKSSSELLPASHDAYLQEPE